jgi:hypothetical protein
VVTSQAGDLARVKALRRDREWGVKKPRSQCGYEQTRCGAEDEGQQGGDGAMLSFVSPQNEEVFFKSH